jgi:hypothetical protein
VIVLLVLLWEKGKNCRGLRRTATTGKQMMRDCEVKGTVLYSTYVPAHPSTLVPWHQTNLKNATKDRTAICTSGTSQKKQDTTLSNGTVRERQMDPPTPTFLFRHPIPPSQHNTSKQWPRLKTLGTTPSTRCFCLARGILESNERDKSLELA